MKNLIDATRSFVFEIQDDDIKNAKRYDKNNCVIANALCASPGIQKVEVGKRYTKIWNGRKITRYLTSTNLGNALEKFDATGKWDLPTGVYQMRVPTPGRTLESERAYEKTRDARQKENKKKHDPAKKGIHQPRPLNHVNHRVIEFAKMRKGQKPAFDNLDTLAGEGL